MSDVSSKKQGRKSLPADPFADYGKEVPGSGASSGVTVSSNVIPLSQFFKPGVEERLRAERIERIALLDAALGYVSRYGWKVFPSKGKKPCKAGKNGDGSDNWGMTDDPEQIRRDIKDFRPDSLGLPTGAVNGIFVIEADTLKGHNVDGVGNLARLEARHAPLPDTLMAMSPSDSPHRIYKHPGKGFTVRDPNPKLAPGVDIKGDGGMVIIPPSVRSGVGVYRWLNDLPIADAPQWLLDLVCEKSKDDAEPDPYTNVNPHKPASKEEVVTAFVAADNPDLDWDDWNRIGMSGFSGHPDAFEGFDLWSQKSSKYDRAKTKEKWEKFKTSPPTQITVGTLFKLARDSDPDWRDNIPEESKTDGNTGQDDKPPKPPRFKLIPFHELRPSTALTYLVKGIIPRVGLVIVWGPPKCGKSFWMFTVVMHVALGWEYRDRKVQSGPVVYCAFEGGAGFNKRAEAFRQEHGIAADTVIPFYLQPLRMNLVKDHKRLIDDIKAQTENPVMVVLDTLNRSLSGSESSDADMSAYVNAADAIREAFGCCVAIVHHCGHDGTRPRGHTSLPGAVEAQLAVSREENIITVEVEMAKDDAEGDKIISQLKTVGVGTDVAGDETTSCVILPADEEFGHPDGPSKKMPTGANKIALDLLWKAIKEAGEIPPANDHIPPDTKAVPVETWQRYCGDGMISESKDPKSKERVFRRARTALQDARYIGYWTDWVWPKTFHAAFKVVSG